MNETVTNAKMMIENEIILEYNYILLFLSIIKPYENRDSYIFLRNSSYSIVIIKTNQLYVNISK